ncbi:putative circularly permuted ATP-grasp superfamily protein [Azomonas agilis]|uniref:Putative circularly permuted ATP-grasp superfamily protein n=1 Tax=Azomonas agilis TaxID=116849 RepID=A0A562HYW3_9GAMM|nr:circularly permuted type 2 ATP-grasp protein [Azomonas agilis]TWH63931.1 putative circularly permuted ATP-grasp superfamily protein [Azomonas agilis]
MSNLLIHYPHNNPSQHELFDAKRVVRPHWQRLLKHLQEGGREHLQQHQALLERQIQENGVTYNVYAEPDGTDRPWKLDLLPHLIPAEEWHLLASGVEQRARLLNAVLGDVYGPQQLLAEGLLPSDLIFGHEQFLWPCQDIQPPGGIWLHLYAVDLTRGPDGRWWVTADRTQAASGAGYALENRHLISRAFPELYRDLRVEHIASYFRTLLDTLAHQAPVEDNEKPLVVLLTPGRFNESYFEHLYLARQLGYPLVEGSDLTVRDGTLYLKSLAGLRRVHAVLRRLNDDFCDPLELRTDSALGVPGLLDSVRRGRVLVANALGSGVLESAGLPGFLPAINRRLFGEELQLPSVASWWCGEPPVLKEALEKLPELLIRPAFGSQSFQACFGPELTPTQLNELRERLCQRPYAYVGLERPKMSVAPIWHNQSGRIEARPLAMRLFAVARPDGSYYVMPGGLSRVAAKADAEVLSMQRGGASKDTWILGARQATTDPWQHVKPLKAREVVRSDHYLPSRMVENLFWFGRYCERCEGEARLLRIMLSRYIDDDNDPQAMQAALVVAEGLGLVPQGKTPELEQRLIRAVLDEDWPPSLRSNLQRLHWAATNVRGKLSRENWQAMLELQKMVLPEANNAESGELLELLDRLLLSTVTLSGFALDDMTRDDGWRFLMTGRRIERLQFICNSLASFISGPTVQDPSALAWLLELGNSSITYRTRYLASPQLIPVLDLLLLDDHNPHAVVFQLHMLIRGVQCFSERFDFPLEQTLSDLHHQLLKFNLDQFESEHSSAARQDSLNRLADLLRQISHSSAQLSDRLGLRFFAHIDTSQQTQSL